MQIVGSTLVDGQTPKENFVATKSPAEFAVIFWRRFPHAHSPEFEHASSAYFLTRCISAMQELYKANNLPGGHIVMLGPGNEQAAMEAIKAYPGGFQVGGGINPSNAQKYLDAGASHVIVTSYVFTEGKLDKPK